MINLFRLKISISALIFTSIIQNAQTEIKANMIFAPAGILSATLEHKLNNYFTIQEEIFISPWKSFAGIGNSQGLYKGFLKDSGERTDKAMRWNKSGEIIPTRGGLMFTYKL